MQVIGFYQNNKQSLAKLVALAKAENVNFFDYSVMLDHVIPETDNSRFLTRLYNEVLFMNNIYLDYFNYSFTSIEDLTDSYNFGSVDQCKEFLALCKEVHYVIHDIK